MLRVGRAGFLWLVVLSLVFGQGAWAKEDAKSHTDAIQYHWVQMAPQGFFVAKAVLPDLQSACPKIWLDDEAVDMIERQNALYEEAFPIKVCQAKFAQNSVRRVTFANGASVRLPETYHTFAVVGDTGCRSTSNSAQNCADPHAYPVASLASAIAAEPGIDAVIHVGDYYYAEECKVFSRADGAQVSWKCGDNWETWKQDFFEQHAQWFAERPVILARGNHEDCRRGAKGWFVLLDVTHEAVPSVCSDYSAIYWVDLPSTGQSLRFWVADSAGYFDGDPLLLQDEKIDFHGKNAQQVKMERSQELEKTKGILSRMSEGKHEAIWISHKPDFVPMVERAALEKQFTDSKLSRFRATRFLEELEAQYRPISSSVTFALAGHVHMAGLYSHTWGADGGNHLVHQIIAGNGGAMVGKFEHAMTQEVQDVAEHQAHFFAYDDFGFLVMKRDPERAEQWSLSYRDRHGDVVQRCIAGKTMHFVCAQQ